MVIEDPVRHGIDGVGDPVQTIAHYMEFAALASLVDELIGRDVCPVYLTEVARVVVVNQCDDLDSQGPPNPL